MFLLSTYLIGILRWKGGRKVALHNSVVRGGRYSLVFILFLRERIGSVNVCALIFLCGMRGVGMSSFFPILAVFLPFTSDQVWTLLVGTEYRHVKVLTMVSLVSFSQGMMKKGHGIPVNRDSFKERIFNIHSFIDSVYLLHE